MASVIISGDTSGTVTLSAPAVAGSTTLTLPAVNGTVSLEGVSYVNQTGSRVLGTTYTNSTGRSIFVSVHTLTGGSLGTLSWSIDGVEIARQGVQSGASATGRVNLVFIVPNGSTYAATVTAGTHTLQTWFEL
tara:strand:- start:13 stop:411 length:399 start_codon:yes stop_codon:yes gene_type:complete